MTDKMNQSLTQAMTLLKELRDTTPITAQRKRIDAFLGMGPPTPKDEYHQPPAFEVPVEYPDTLIERIAERIYNDRHTGTWAELLAVGKDVSKIQKYRNTAKSAFAVTSSEISAKEYQDTIDRLYAEIDKLQKREPAEVYKSVVGGGTVFDEDGNGYAVDETKDKPQFTPHEEITVQRGKQEKFKQIFFYDEASDLITL